jgi:5-methylcytosine-specific restriction endonuclease McrA
MIELYAAPPIRPGFDKTKLKLGQLCKQNHDWMSTGQSLRRIRGRNCVECERLRAQDRISSGERREFRQEKYNSLRNLGITTRGTPLRSPAMQASLLADDQTRQTWIAIGHAGRCPSVAKLVMDEQRQYWQDHPETKKEHDRQWRQAIWWLNYQIRPELRLYHRQKSKRRKALERGSVGIQVKGCQITKRFAEFGHRCAYCGATGDLHIEHVNPISKGGTHVLSNVVPACQYCNYSKRAKDAETWYRAQPFFCKKRWAKILKVMGAGKGSPQQLALL